MQEGTLIRWLKDEGSNVDLGEPVAEIETDKAVVEFESYASGVLREILVPEGSTVPVGEAIAVVGEAVSAASAAQDPEPAAEVVEESAASAEPSADDGESDAPSSEPSAPAAIPLGAASETVAESAAEPQPAPEPEPAAAPPAPARRVLATPIARQMAQDAGIDLADVDGSGPGGRIVREDVESAIAARQTAQDAAESVDDVVAESAESEESAQPELEPEPEIAAEAASEEDEGAEDEEESAGEPVAETESEGESDDEESEAEPAVEIAVAASVEDDEPESEPAEEEAEAEPEIAVEIAVAVSVEDDESESAEEAEREVSFEIAVAASDDDGEAEPAAAVGIAIAASVEDEAEEPSESEVAEPEDADEADDGLLPLSRTRRQIARVTTRSKSEKPHFYVNVDVDMTDAMALRSQINAALAADGVRVTVNDMIIAASAIALKRFPKFNAYYEEGGVRMNDGVNVGVAMALEEGLIMPAIVGAGGMSLREIAQASKDLSERAQRGALSAPEYSGGTFAISNMGMMGVTGFTAIIQPPQTAVLAVGAVQKRAMVADDDRIAVRQMMTATLSADHRIVDGAEGAMFVNEIKSLLENPLSVIL